MELAKGIKFYITVQTLIFVFSVTALSLVFWFVASFRASSGVIACLLFRFIIPDLPDKSWFVLAQILGFVIVIYGFIGTKAVVIQFLFFTSLLQNGVECWNKRLRNKLHRVEGGDSQLEEFRRNKYRLLLKDHFILVQLFKLTEVVFALLLQFYYLTKIICLIVQIMFLWYLLGPQSVRVDVFQNSTITIDTPKIMITDNEKFTEKQSIIATWTGILMLFETILARYSTNEHATVAYIEAMMGFQIVRKHGFINCNSSSEKNFIVGTVCAYFIILIQFPPEFYKVSEDEFRLKWGVYVDNNATRRG